MSISHLAFILAATIAAFAVLAIAETSTPNALACTTIMNAREDQVCQTGNCCIYNFTSRTGSKIAFHVEEGAQATMNFNKVSSGQLSTIESAGTTNVYCTKTSTCQDIRLLGETIKAWCTGMSSCQLADCEGSSSQIVDCSGFKSCTGSKGCGVKTSNITKMN